MIAEWILPAAAFVLVEGALGITTKLALRGVAWRQLLLWTAVTYAGLAAVLIAVAGESVPIGPGVGWAVLSGLLASVSLLIFFVALERGDASRVVPVTAGYPLVTAILAAIVLSEEISVMRAIGTVLVVAGVVWLGRQ